MAKSKEQKKQLLKSYREAIKNASSIIVVKPTQLTPNEVNEFRKSLFDFNSEFRVVKNTIFKLALEQEGMPAVEDILSGEHAVLFSSEDFVSPSKILNDFVKATTSRDLKKVVVKAGILQGNLLNAEQVQEIADMPTIEGSISQILGILDMSMSGVVNVLEDSVRSYLTIIDLSFKE